MEIPKLVRQCLKQFRSLLGDAQDDKLEEEYGRFRVWTGNLAAHREVGSRSLEYRLKDSENLRIRVLSLLGDLLIELQDCKLHEHGDQPRLGAGPLNLTFVDDDFGAGDSTQDIHELVNLLYRFSITLMNPAGYNRVRRAFIPRSAAFDPWFIPHVQNKYPSAQAWLAQRLGRAISSRRQYIIYRDIYGKKKHQGLENEAPDEQTTTVATSIPGVKPPTLDVADLNKDADDTESFYSMTSFAPTESDASVLRPPRLPEKGASGDPFDCPICNSIVQFTNKERWRRHVYEDVPPYVCTHEACSTANMQYTKRRDWQRHMSRNHFRVWKCSVGCSAQFSTADDLITHLVDDHKQPSDASDLQRLAEICAEPMPLSEALTCPLCQKLELTLSSWFKHVGRHMEQLALFALPSHLLEDEQEGQNEDESADEMGTGLESGSDVISIGGSCIEEQDAAVDENTKRHEGVYNSTHEAKAEILHHLNPSDSSEDLPVSIAATEYDTEEHTGPSEASRATAEASKERVLVML
ncbi:uncharacterized protein MYCFIDRAFT_34701 [Pseudocercospora fijiensis CIRAD86]|uniref:C2H2-type domain-containing protein n=1 Tax=Pseudocercospora fijiensis (strain CIRAD86) TaxID=383855 RepID=M3ANX5_PSEFD|nr:uncharacterized protein MYCFIDRAFT_34701 [Pseudocercospora fijiensis CIRAD86]EME79157.1 hypothetical protein MYCFIDRAFT_34701 [Pseudocercospora fijiensis CIRAD86]